MLDNPHVDPAPKAVQTQGQRVARILLAVGLVLLGLYVLEGFLRALVWAVILVIATWPLFARAQRRFPPGRHNILMPLAFTICTALVFLGPIATLVLQLGHEARTIAAWVADTREHGAPLPDALTRLPIAQQQVAAWWQANLADPEGARALLGRVDRAEMMQVGRSLGTQLAHRGILFAFMLVTLFFLYRDGQSLAQQMLVASRRLFGPHGETVGRQMVASVHGTVDGLVLVGLGTGVVLGIGYYIVGVPHPALLGAASAVGAMIPLGATIMLAIASLLAFVGGNTVGGIALFLGGSVVIFAADHFIRPSLIGGATKLPFLWVLLGILGGVETFGLLGLFLGPAVMAALILLWRDWVGDATKTAS